MRKPRKTTAYQQRATNTAIKGVHTALFGEPTKRQKKN